MYAAPRPGPEMPCDLGPESPARPVARAGRRVSTRPLVLGAIFLGGCVGGLARYGLSAALPTSQGWPWGTFAANTLGALLLGLLLVLLLERWTAPPWVRAGLGTGLLGSFTTMSGVALTVDMLALDRHVTTAAGFLAASMLAGLGAAALGMLLGRCLLAHHVRER